MHASPADQLRQRAATLRQLARRLDDLRALQLARRCGPDTWVGPSQYHCEQALRSVRTALLTQAFDLFTQANRMERTADHLDALSRSTAR